MRSVIRTAVFAAASLAAAISFGASAPRQQAQAQLLDHAEFLCANCFFGASDYYYCFAAGDQVLVAYQKIPVLNWQDKSKNYLTRFHHEWALWSASGQSIPVSYDAKHMWVSRADGEPVKLIRSPLRDIFTNDRCRAAGTVKAH
jgi:hypothetical protein